MKKSLILSVVVSSVLCVASVCRAHCEVPCGIYDDQLRFQQMLEDCDTIAKGMKSVEDLLAEMGDAPTPLAVNQMVRWTNTKEDHATKIQHIISQYFLTQRIKPTSERYVDQLKAAHAVLVAAMKCKQTVDQANADQLRESILDLYRAYEGKEPNLEKEDK